MFEITLFNTAQIFDQLFAFVCVYLLTSLSAKVRFYGFVIGTIGFIPGTYLLVVTKIMVAGSMHLIDIGVYKFY